MLPRQYAELLVSNITDENSGVKLSHKKVWQVCHTTARCRKANVADEKPLTVEEASEKLKIATDNMNKWTTKWRITLNEHE